MILVWLILFIGYTVCAALIVPRTTIDRYKAAPKDWQYWVAHLLFYSIPASWFLGAEQSSPQVVLTGMLLFTAGGALNVWAMASNPYFSPEIAMPMKVVTGGAYRWLDHPGYLGMVLMAEGSYLLAAHPLAAVPLTAYAALLTWRARRESLLLTVTKSARVLEKSH